jgi:hypothetical protein
MGVIGGFLCAIILALFIRLLGVEIGAHHKPLCRWLVKGAACRLPDGERAAAESEWLQVIEDLRSPTAQLLHSLSFAFSAFRIREEIEPQARGASIFKSVIAIQMGGLGVGTGVMTSLLFDHKDALVEIVRQHVAISKPVALALLVATVLATCAAAYVNHRLMMWYFGRRARRRTSTTIE